MGLPFCALFDPAAEGFDFGGGEGGLGVFGWHPLRVVGGGDAGEEDAGGGVAFDDGVAGFAGRTASEIGFGEGFAVEAEGDFFGGGVGAVADEALVGEDGADIPIKLEAIEFDRLGSEGLGEYEQERSATEHRSVFYGFGRCVWGGWDRVPEKPGKTRRNGCF